MAAGKENPATGTKVQSRQQRAQRTNRLGSGEESRGWRHKMGFPELGWQAGTCKKESVARREKVRTGLASRVT